MPLVNPYDDSKAPNNLDKQDNGPPNNGVNDVVEQRTPIVNPFDDSKDNTTIVDSQAFSPYPVEADLSFEDRFWMSGVRDHEPSIKATLESKPFVKKGSVRRLGDTNNYVYVDKNDNKVKYYEPPKTEGLVNKGLEGLKDAADIGRDIVRGTGAGMGYVAGGGQASGLLSGALAGQGAGIAFDRLAQSTGVKDLRSNTEYAADQALETLLDTATEGAMIGLDTAVLPAVKARVKQLWQQSPDAARQFVKKIKDSAKSLKTQGVIGDIPTPEKQIEMRDRLARFQGEGITDPTYGMISGNPVDAINEQKMLRQDGAGQILNPAADNVYRQAENRFENIKDLYDFPVTDPVDTGLAIKGELFDGYNGVMGGVGDKYRKNVRKLKASWRDQVPENYHVSTDRLERFFVEQIQKANPPLENGALPLPKSGGDDFAGFLLEKYADIKRLSPNGKMNFERIELMRRDVGNAFNKGYNLTNEQKQDFYFALRETEKDALREIDPSGKLANKFEAYNKYVTNFLDPKKGVNRDKYLKSLADKKFAIDATKDVLAGLKSGGNPQKIEVVKRYLKPEEFSYISGLALEQLSRNTKNQFSLSAIAGNWKKLTPATKKALFNNRDYPGLVKNLDDFVSVADDIQKWINETNWSRSGAHIAHDRTPLSFEITSWANPAYWPKMLKAGLGVAEKIGRKSQAHLLTNQRFIKNVIEYGRLIDETHTVQGGTISRRITPAVQRKMDKIMLNFGLLSVNDPLVEAWVHEKFPEHSEKMQSLIKR